MIEFLAAHKLGLLLGAVLAGGLIYYMRKRGGGSTYTNGVPVDTYASNANNDGGGFDLGNLLPQGPAGPVLDPTSANTSAPPPAAVGAPEPTGDTPTFTDPTPVYYYDPAPTLSSSTPSPSISIPVTPPPDYNPVGTGVRGRFSGG